MAIRINDLVLEQYDLLGKLYRGDGAGSDIYTNSVGDVSYDNLVTEIENKQYLIPQRGNSSIIGKPLVNVSLNASSDKIAFLFIYMLGSGIAPQQDSLEFQNSTFNNLYQIEIELATDAYFNNVVAHEILEQPLNSSWVYNFLPGTTYYARARYRLDNIVSSWSDVATVHDFGIYTYIEAPVFTVDTEENNTVPVDNIVISIDEPNIITGSGTWDNIHWVVQNLKTREQVHIQSTERHININTGWEDTPIRICCSVEGADVVSNWNTIYYNTAKATKKLEILPYNFDMIYDKPKMAYDRHNKLAYVGLSNAVSGFNADGTSSFAYSNEINIVGTNNNYMPANVVFHVAGADITSQIAATDGMLYHVRDNYAYVEILNKVNLDDRVSKILGVGDTVKHPKIITDFNDNVIMAYSNTTNINIKKVEYQSGNLTNISTYALNAEFELIPFGRFRYMLIVTNNYTNPGTYPVLAYNTLSGVWLTLPETGLNMSNIKAFGSRNGSVYVTDDTTASPVVFKTMDVNNLTWKTVTMPTDFILDKDTVILPEDDESFIGFGSDTTTPYFCKNRFYRFYL